MSNAAWTSLADVTARPVRWLWNGRIPLGKLSLLEGEPGVGKSTLALDLAARVSRGAAMPFEPVEATEPATVVIYSGDDGLAETVRPRLEAAGADLTKIHAVDREIDAGDLAGREPALIVLDPLSAYLCLSCEPNSRRVLKGLIDLAASTGAAFLAVQGIAPGDSAEWVAEIRGAARSVLTLTTLSNRTSPDAIRRLAVTKSNLRHLNEVRPLVYHHEDKGGVAQLVRWSDTL